LLAEQIAGGAKKAGAKIETVYLHGLDISPCTGCFSCQKSKSRGCIIKDDMQPLYRMMIEADAWVIASPVYWFSVSAQTKLWMDRSLALPAYRKDPFSGKRIAIAMSYGAEDPFDSGCVNALRTFQDAYRFVKAEIVGMVYGSAIKAGEIGKNKALLKAAEELGKELAAVT